MQPLHLGRFLTNKRCGASREADIVHLLKRAGLPSWERVSSASGNLWVCRYPGVALFARECHRIGLERRHHRPINMLQQ